MRQAKSRASYDGPNPDMEIPWGRSLSGDTIIWGETRDRKRYFVTERDGRFNILPKGAVGDVQKAAIGQFGTVDWEGEEPWSGYKRGEIYVPYYGRK